MDLESWGRWTQDRIQDRQIDSTVDPDLQRSTDSGAIWKDGSRAGSEILSKEEHCRPPRSMIAPFINIEQINRFIVVPFLWLGAARRFLPFCSPDLHFRFKNRTAAFSKEPASGQADTR